jgi:hypothetical protein
MQRRFTIENVKQSTRQLAKLTSGGNALIVFDSLMKQAKEYDN